MPPDNTFHTEIELPDRSIRVDLYCSEHHLREYRRQTSESYIYEPEVIGAIVNFVRPGDVCIDAGANIGYHTLLMAKFAGPNGKVLAFEPDPDCKEKLRRNFALNDVDDICEHIPAALWSANSEAAIFYVNECGYGSFLKFRNADQTETIVKALALDNIIRDGVAIRLIKIDCEGAEQEILKGANRLLRSERVDAIIAEFNFAFSYNDKEIRQYMHDLGYDLFYLNGFGKLPQLIPLEATIQGGLNGRFHFNGLFCKQNWLRDNWKLSFDGVTGNVSTFQQ